jgi:hypothetical protein
MATSGTQDKEKRNKNTTQYVLDTMFVLFGLLLLDIVFSVLQFTASDYFFGILDLWLLITPLVS